MRKFLTICFALCLFRAASAQQTIYSVMIDSASGGAKIDFSSLQGKKILIVDLASQDSSFSQYSELQLLSQQYQGSLYIIAIPTNSFGSEPGDSSSIISAYTQSGSGNVLVAARLSVAGADISGLYQWLTQQSQNGVMDSEVKLPGYKYLINTQGKLVGFFAPRVRPLSDVMINSINNSQ